jgi:trigger factor
MWSEGAPVSVNVTEIAPFERMVTFTIPEAELEQAKSAAARRLSRDLKIPGFRPGRAPRKVVEAAVGVDRLRSEAVDDVLPGKVDEILESEGLDVAGRPTLDALRNVDNGFEVDVKVALWPVLDDAPEYVGKEIECESPLVTDEEVEEQLTMMREQFADVDEVDRAAGEGDYVVLNLTGSKDGERVEELDADGLFYEVGSGMLIEGLDEHVDGASKGDVIEFDGELPAGFGEQAGEAVSFKVLVTEVREKTLPELTDEWVDENTEFDTVEEFRTTLTRRLGQRKLDAVYDTYRRTLLDAIGGSVELEVPMAIVRAEMDEMLHRFMHRLEEQNVSLEDYFEITGMDQQQLVADLEAQARGSIHLNLALDAIAEDAGTEVTDEELHGAIESLKAMAGPEAGELRIEGTPQEKRIALDILRQKAMDTLLASAVPVDPDGNAIDFKALAAELAEPDEEDEDDDGEEAAEVVDAPSETEDTAAVEEEE